MTQKLIIPTSRTDEESKGRIALWLDIDDLKWLAKHCCCSADASQIHTDRCLRIRFRAHTALHKSNIAE